MSNNNNNDNDDEVDLSSPKVWNLKDRLTFGKYKGNTIAEVVSKNAQYLIWCSNSIEWFELSDSALQKVEDTVMQQRNYYHNVNRQLDNDFHRHFDNPELFDDDSTPF
jgi:hypothetical protein